MDRRFLAAIDAAVDRALPAGWPRLPRHWLPARGSVQARQAFRLAHDIGPRPYLVVVAVPPFVARTAAVEGDLAALVDHILARGGTLLLLYEHESDPNGWVREHLDFPHPRFLCLPCFAPDNAPGEPSDRCSTGAGKAAGGAGVADDVAEAADAYDAGHADEGDGRDGDPAGEDYIAAPAYNRREALSDVIRGLWSGHLFYRGPCEGVQTVFVEIMKGTCWRCHFSLDIVTGIVFPDREVADWSLPDWTYYQALLQLARIPDPIIPALSAAVEAWRASGDRRLTVIRWRYSKSVENAYWAAECTACGAFQGDFPMMDKRLRWLGDLKSRRTGILRYRPLRLDVPRQALQELTWSAEVNPHSRFIGWYRSGDPELEGSTAVEGFHAVTVLAFSDGADGRAGLPGDAGPDRAAGLHGSAESKGPDLPPGAAASLPTPIPDITGTADLGLHAPPPATSAEPSGHGPVQRLGEILSTWLGWMGAGRRPPGPPETETSEGAPAVDEKVSV